MEEPNLSFIEELIKMLNSHKTVEKIQAIQDLGISKDIRAVEPLLDFLENGKGNEAFVTFPFLIQALGAIGDVRAVEPLIKLFDSNSEYLRKELILEALGEIGGTKAVQILISALQKGNHWERVASAKGLRLVRDATALNPLLHSLKKDDDDGVRYFVALALAEIGDDQTINVLEEVRQKNNERDKNVRLNNAIVQAIETIKKRQSN
jgi:HEAT repeat protein